ncbi:MAG: nucleotidyl transferase AbiEii/AbiGii toxin family protein [Patescibacteria group bacterium]|nr:nucleotidyl transferase AbiEii/AbiGii toxin family protein [Patescibacteria group bacterium]
MLDLGNILSEYPEEFREFPRFAYKEYLQYKILSIVFRHKLGKKLSFLGGTALRIVHGNRRFSEDLDFDNFGLKLADFSKIISEVEKELEKEGFLVETRIVAKGAFRCYVRFPEIFQRYGLAIAKEEKILIQIDTAAHGVRYEPDTYLLNKFDVFREIRVTPPDIILSQKIFAVFNRKRDLGRDYFDVVFLLSKTKPNWRYLKEKLSVGSAAELKKKLLRKCGKLDFRILARDVEPFLFKNSDKEKVLKFTKVIENL